MFFWKKISFSRPKSVMTFRIFPFFQRFSISFTMLNVVYDPFLTRTTTISEKNSFMTPFFIICSYFRAHPTTLFLKILGGTDAWAVTPPEIFGGPSPQVSAPGGDVLCLKQVQVQKCSVI